MSSDNTLQAFLPLMEVKVIPKPKTVLSPEQAVDRALVMIRKAVADGGWSLDALAAHMGKSRAHIHRILNGERPMTLLFMAQLPPDVKVGVAKGWAEAFGFYVVTPAEGEAAVKNALSIIAGARGAA